MNYKKIILSMVCTLFTKINASGIPDFPLMKPDGTRLTLSDPIPIPKSYEPLFDLLDRLHNPELTLSDAFAMIDEFHPKLEPLK